MDKNHSVKASQNSQRRYQIDQNKVCIDLMLRHSQQLFDAKDPSPFIERDLDDDAVAYILAAAEEFPRPTPLKIRIHIREEPRSERRQEDIRMAVHNYFQYTSNLLQMRLRKTRKQAQIFLFIGIAFLFVCLVGAKQIENLLNGSIAEILREGLVITGWVAMWRPLELMLYDLWPLWEKMKFHEKLMGTEVEVYFSS